MNGFPILDDDIDRFEFNKSLHKEIQYFRKTNQTVKQCMDMLEKFVLNDMEIIGANAVLDDFIKMYIIPFFRHVLMIVVEIGWCPYTLRKITDPRTKVVMVVPEVAPLQYINTSVLVSKKTFDIVISPTYSNDGDPVPGIKFLLFTDLLRIANNNVIDSVLEGLLVEHRYCEQVRRFTVQAEFVRSNPTIYLREDTTLKAGKTADSTGLMDRSVSVLNGDDDRRAYMQVKGVSRAKPGELLERASQDIIQNVEFHAMQMRDMFDNASRSYYDVGLGVTPQHHNNLFVCPPNMMLAANPQLPESRVDQLTIDRALSSKVYLAFGIPESLIGFVGGTSSGTRSSTSRSSSIRKDVNVMDLIGFEASIERYRHFFAVAFASIYEDIFGKPMSQAKILFKSPQMYEDYVKFSIEENKEAIQDTPEKDESKHISKKKKRKVNDDGDGRSTEKEN